MTGRSTSFLRTATSLLALTLGSGAAQAEWVSNGPFCARPFSFSAGATPTAEAYLSARGRVFRSGDGWRTWQEVAGELPENVSFIAPVAADPARPERVFTAAGLARIFRSLDGGEHWQPTSVGLPTGAIYIDGLYRAGPSELTVFADSLYKGVFRSDDLGVTWREMTPAGAGGGFRLLPPHPRLESRLWLNNGRLWRSDDAGDSWVSVVSGLPEDDPVHLLTLDPARPSGAFAVSYERLYRTVDARSWSRVGDERIPIVTGNKPTAFVALPGDPPILIAGQEGDGFPFPPGSPLDQGVLRSVDGGLSWQDGGLVGETVYELLYHAQTGRVVALTGSGAFVSSDLGVSWKRTGDGIDAAEVRALAVGGDGEHPVILAAVDECDYLRVARSEDGGRTWRLSRTLLVLRPTSLAVAPSDPDRVYLGADNSGIHRSDDGGVTWDFHTAGSPLTLAVHPTDPDVVFADGDGLRRSLDGGVTWEDGLGPFETIGAIAIDPRDGDRIYIGSRDASDPGVARSLDGGDTWLQLASVLNQWPVADIELDPHDPDTVYVSFYRIGHPVYKSLDGGDTWAAAAPGIVNVGLEELALDPTTPGLVVAATSDDGVYRSLDGGASWQAWPDAVGEEWITDVAVDPRGRVFAAVAGRGVYSPGPLSRTEPCRSDPHTACLLDGAFEVRGTTWDFDFPAADRELRVMSFPDGRAESDQAVFFESFSAGNFELGIKMVDACGLPSEHPHRAYWVFAGGLTSAGAEVVIEDLATGADYRWTNAPGEFPRALGDTGAFPCVEGPSPPACERDGHTACLLDGRFRVTGTMYDFSDPPVAIQARVMRFAGGRAESAQAAFFDSFRPGNFEIGVKMVDACDLPEGNPLRAFWAFYGGLTSAEAQVVITQLATGRVDEWSNTGGTFAQTEGHTAAFPCLD